MEPRGGSASEVQGNLAGEDGEVTSEDVFNYFVSEDQSNKVDIADYYNHPFDRYVDDIEDSGSVGFPGGL